MKISVTHIDDSENLILEFRPYGPKDRRLWIRDSSQWYQTVGRWCPHINLGHGECNDCALNLE